MGLLTNSPEVKETDLILGAGETYTSITDHISDVVLKNRTPLEWFVIAAPAALLAGGILVAMLNLLFRGIGVWGPNVPVGWGFDIINFVWWIGIGHAGTLISAILLL